MTTFRSNIAVFFAVALSSSGCSSPSQEDEVQQLRNEVNSLRNEMQETQEEQAEFSIDDSWGDEKDSVAPVAQATKPSAISDPSLDNQMKMNEIKKSVDDLRMRSDLERMDRDIKAAEDERRARQEKISRKLGLE